MLQVNYIPSCGNRINLTFIITESDELGGQGVAKRGHEAVCWTCLRKRIEKIIALCSFKDNAKKYLYQNEYLLC